MEEIMAYLHNYFYKFKEKGTLKIEFNSITQNGEALRGNYVEGQYVRIVGSVSNDGIYRVVATQSDDMPGITLDGCLTDETFTGYICSLSVPKQFIRICGDIQAYNTENKQGTMISESFGGYSYTKATVNGQLATWKDAYSTDLRPYRRMTDGFKWVKEI